MMRISFFNKFLASIVMSVGSIFLSANFAQAERVLLDNTRLLYEGEGIDVNLYGEKLDNGYAYDLLLVAKRDNGSLVTIHNPSITGGYGFSLFPAKLKDKDCKTEQLVIMAKQGDWRTYSEFRVLDFGKKTNVKEIFSSVDSLGVVNYGSVENRILKVKTLNDKEPVTVDINKKILADVADNRLKLQFSKLQSLVAIDIDNDGKHELVSNQQLIVDKKVLADVGAVWRYIGPKEETAAADKSVKEVKAKSNSVKDILKAADEFVMNMKKEKDSTKVVDTKLWRYENMTIMKNDIVDKRNTVNEGAFFNGGMVYPVKMISANGEATFPQFSLSSNPELKNTWNKLLLDESKEYINNYLNGSADMAFNVLRADNKLISIELISGKNSFVRHYVNFMPGRKAKLQLVDILDIKNKKLIELLKVLNTNKGFNIDKNLTDEWFIARNHLILKKSIEGKEEKASFALADLQKFIILDSLKEAKENRQ